MATGRWATKAAPRLGERRRNLVKRWGGGGVALVAWTDREAGARHCPYQRRAGENHLSYSWFSPSLTGPLVASFLLHPPRLVLLTLRLAVPRGLVALPPGLTVGGAGGQRHRHRSNAFHVGGAAWQSEMGIAAKRDRADATGHSRSVVLSGRAGGVIAAGGGSGGRSGQPKGHPLLSPTITRPAAVRRDRDTG